MYVLGVVSLTVTISLVSFLFPLTKIRIQVAYTVTLDLVSSLYRHSLGESGVD